MAKTCAACFPCWTLYMTPPHPVSPQATLPLTWLHISYGWNLAAWFLSFYFLSLRIHSSHTYTKSYQKTQSARAEKWSNSEWVKGGEWVEAMHSPVPSPTSAEVLLGRLFRPSCPGPSQDFLFVFCWADQDRKFHPLIPRTAVNQ